MLHETSLQGCGRQASLRSTDVGLCRGDTSFTASGRPPADRGLSCTDSDGPYLCRGKLYGEPENRAVGGDWGGGGWAWGADPGGLPPPRHFYAHLSPIAG